MGTADRCSNWLIIAGWVLMVSGGAVFLSIVFAGAGIAIFVAGVALCVLGGVTAGVSALCVSLQAHLRVPTLQKPEV